MSESAKVRPRVLSYLSGKTVADLGCGTEKIVPWAVGVDDYREQAEKSGADVVCPLEKYDPDEPFDVVFSSHALEHLPAPLGETLGDWVDMVKPGGHLILYLPDERRYVYDPANPKVRNPAHKHYLTPDIIRWHLEQLPVEIETVEPDGYSFLVIARKVG